MVLSKTTALSDGKDEIRITYKIEDDNGVPLRNIPLEDIKLTVDGEARESFILTSDIEKVSEVVITYENLVVKSKVKFIKDSRVLRLSLSKAKILADGKDEIIIGVGDNDGKMWNNPVTLYVNEKKNNNNIFKTKKAGEYVIKAKSGKFESKKIKIIAYEEIKELTLSGSKNNILTNGIDKITFTLKGVDQNRVTHQVKNFVLVDSNGEKISNSNVITTTKSGTYKVKAIYKEQFSNYITYTAKSPQELDIVSFYPKESTINLNTKIEIKLNLQVKNYSDGIEVLLDKKPIDGKISYDKDSNILIFTPTNLLKLNSKYQVKLKRSVVGVDENNLERDFTFEFETINKKKIDMIKIEKGQFILGDQTRKLWNFSSPTQEAFITYDYLIGEAPVTFEIYDQYTRDMKLPLIDDNGWGRKSRPVINITWYDTIDFLNWLSKKENLPIAYDKDGDLIDNKGHKTRDITKVFGYRLPTEIEWEFAGKGGTKMKKTLFSGSDKLRDVSWYSENSNGKTHEIKTKFPNELGIYDMNGNVWEWINDNSGVYSGIERIK